MDGKKIRNIFGNVRNVVMFFIGINLIVLVGFPCA